MIRKIAEAAQELGESGVAATVKLAKSLALQWLRATAPVNVIRRPVGKSNPKREPAKPIENRNRP